MPAAKPKAEPKRTGRKPKLNDDEQTIRHLKTLAQCMATTREAAASLGVSEPTFFAFLKRSEKAKDAWELGKLAAPVSVRAALFKRGVKEGNVTALIWLSKQHCGMTDKVEQTVDATVEHVDRSELKTKAMELQEKFWTEQKGKRRGRAPAQ